MSDIDARALDSLAVTPDSDAGQDSAIATRLKDDPDSADAKLDDALDESMDASDPVASTQPERGGDPAPSSGYDEEAERARTDQA